MTLVLRRSTDRTHYRKLRQVGECWVSFSQIVGAFGTGKITRIIWIGA